MDCAPPWVYVAKSNAHDEGDVGPDGAPPATTDRKWHARSRRSIMPGEIAAHAKYGQAVLIDCLHCG